MANQNAWVDTKVADGKMSQSETNKIHKENHVTNKKSLIDGALPSHWQGVINGKGPGKTGSFSYALYKSIIF